MNSEVFENPDSFENKERDIEELIEYYFQSRLGFKKTINAKLKEFSRKGWWFSDLEVLESVAEDMIKNRDVQLTSDEKAKLVNEISIMRRPEEKK